MTIRIEVLGPADAAVLERVAPDLFDDPVDAGATAEVLADPRHHLVVALDGETVVGFVSAVHYVHPDDPRPELWVNEVAVAASHRRRGIGRRMIEAALGLAGRLGCSEAWVLADRSNQAAHRLYRSAGGVAHREASVLFTFTPTPGADA
ncbi:MAG TPA: GNAT family N-acetyltransferase [Thermoanaerobaculia bacterium]|nr:GNAT family N-acetyltransferase [Thermoanaerobaculia bacterium]